MMTDIRFKRTETLIGTKALSRLQGARVAIFGIGGVGSYAAEAVARAGIGQIDLFDRDTVDITNINRQLIALTSTVGQPKAAVMQARILQINPAAKVLAHTVFVTPAWTEQADFSKYDYVLDAVDNITAKISLCKRAWEQGVPIISAMGAGNKLDPTGFRVENVEKTTGCPLARIMRRELKKRGITGVLAVFSEEPPVQTAAEMQNGRPLPASISYVPSTAGLIMAGRVIRDLMAEPDGADEKQQNLK